jgi:predicted Rossmann-fold nucleotide-binding protein
MEIESLSAFDAYVAAHGASHPVLTGCRIQAVDLTDRGWELRAAQISGAVFLGCVLSDSVAGDLRQRGALVFPPVPHLPFDPYRARLYTPAELYDGIADKPYAQTPDALAHAWDQEPRDREDVLEIILRGLHDDSIADALGEFAVGRRIVGVLGGHAAGRGTAGYLEAARLGRAVARAGYTVGTGGGPGAMEAANLGAYLAPFPDSALDEAVRTLAAVPDFRPDVTAWARAAFAVRAAYPHTAAAAAAESGGPTRLGESLAVPTWFYGHEPPNPFATAIAKFFTNALREDLLLQRAAAGLVFLPGAAGTVQEVFQAATPAYYAPDGSAPPRLILVGVSHWTKTLPAWPLLRSMAEGRAMAERIHLVDTVAEASILLGKEA